MSTSTLSPPPPPPPPPPLRPEPIAATSLLPAPPVPPKRVRRRDAAFSVAALLAMAGALYFDQSPLAVLALLFFVVVPFERLFPRHDQPLRRKFLGMDVGYALMQPALGVIGIAAAIVIGGASLAWLPGLALSPLVAMLPPTVQAIAGIALFDLAIYWVHRWSHEVPFLWRFHSIHHSTEHLDWVSGFRGHPLDGAILAPAFFFLIGAGFSAEFTGVLAVIQILTGLFLHANVRWRWRPLHKLIITPEFHHWHHTNEREAINTNYSVFLPLWDLMFGTYFMPKDRRPSVYGIDQPVPSTIVGQLKHPFRDTKRPWFFVLHPIKGVKLGARNVRSGLRQIWHSTRRPTHTATAQMRLSGGQRP